MTASVAALYVLPQGIYFRMSDVDPWSKRRDARLYPGALPCVAHPSCGPWSRSWAHACTRQDPALAPLAVEQVRQWGGVLEHPARSKLWEVEDLALPLPLQRRYAAAVRGTVPVRDDWGGFTVEVRQCDWGHRAEKLTWLYVVGMEPEDVELPPWRPTPPGPGGISARGWQKCQMDMMSPVQRLATPPAFARWLVDLAARCIGRRGSPSDRTWGTWS